MKLSEVKLSDWKKFGSLQFWKELEIPPIQVPKTPWGQFSLLFFTELVSFFIIVANTRALAQGNYFWTAITDTVFSAQGFVMFKLLADNKEARTWWAGLGCTVGGTVGSLLSIYVTKHLFGM